MLVEHAFITTLEASDCLARVNSLLMNMMYRVRESSAEEIVFVKGLPKPKAKSSLFELPQSVAVRFDRGKVNVAASILTFRDKVSPQQSEMLVKLATAIEAQVTTNDEGERNRLVSPLLEDIKALNQSYKASIDKKSKSSRIVVGLLIAFIIFIFGVIIYISVNGP